MGFCTQCGKPVAEGGRFCSACGAPAVPTGAPARPVVVSGGPSVVLIVAGILLGLVFLLGTLAAIAIPNFLKYKDQAVWSMAQANMDVMRSALAAYAANDPDNLYPSEAYYEDFVDGILQEAQMPADIADAKLLEITYETTPERDTFTITGVAADKNEDVLIAEPEGVTPTLYPH